MDQCLYCRKRGGMRKHGSGWKCGYCQAEFGTEKCSFCKQDYPECSDQRPCAKKSIDINHSRKYSPLSADEIEVIRRRLDRMIKDEDEANSPPISEHWHRLVNAKDALGLVLTHL